MPQLFQAADQASLAAQRSYVRGTQLRLGLLVTAAATGVVSWRVGSGQIDVLALIGVAAFMLALLVEGSLWRNRPDKAWYDGRAVAESAKTLAWKYAVGGLPFPTLMAVPDATSKLIDRLEGVRNQFHDLELEALDAPAISDWMTQQRLSPLDERKQTYLDARVRDQRSWYSKKAIFNKKRSKQWRIALVALEFAGAASSLVAAFTQSPILIPPAIAAIAGAVVAWLETKQHDGLSRAYSAAVADLASAETKLLLTNSESSWATEVDDTEEAISREHVVWLATRSRI